LEKQLKRLRSSQK